MNAKFKQIIDRLNALATFKADKSMDDEDFIANIDAINLLCNLHDDLGLDCSGILGKISRLYPEFPRRIHGKKDIQLAVPLIKALHRYIYGRSYGHGPEKWRSSLAELCSNVVDSYRKNQLISSAEYLFALDIACRANDDADNDDLKEYKEAIAGYIEDIDTASIAEKIRRVRAYERAKHLFVSADWEKWTEARESLKNINLSQLDDETFILWREITDIAPLRELKRRACHSRQMQAEYLQGLIFAEFAKQKRLAANLLPEANTAFEMAALAIAAQWNADMLLSVSSLPYQHNE